MAETLISRGFTAGSGYGEVWIRDMNTFMPVACKVNDKATIRKELTTFFLLQQPDGDIVDGYEPKGTDENYVHYSSPLVPDYDGHKNTVETDQEDSLVQAVYTYIKCTGDTEFLMEPIGGSTVQDRLAMALGYLIHNKIAEPYGLIWGATRIDWGDVQPESEWGVDIDSNTHKALSIYDNAMFLIAVQDYLDMASLLNDDRKKWQTIHDDVKRNVRKYLWDSINQKFIPHIYLDGSPFPPSFDENQIYYHGGTAVAIQAGLLSRKEVLAAYERMQQDVVDSGAPSIGLTIYPPYPLGYFKNPQLTNPYTYQNGGDWGWFGGRMVTDLVEYGYRKEAIAALTPMVDRVIKNNGFWEWWSKDNHPSGSGNFKGEAGVLWTAIQAVDGPQNGQSVR